MEANHWVAALARALLGKSPLSPPSPPLQLSGYRPEVSDDDWEARQQQEMSHLRGISAMAPRGIPWQQWRPSQNIEDRRGENFQPAVPGDVGARMLLDGSILMPDGRRLLPNNQ